MASLLLPLASPRRCVPSATWSSISMPSTRRSIATLASSMPSGSTTSTAWRRSSTTLRAMPCASFAHGRRRARTTPSWWAILRARISLTATQRRMVNRTSCTRASARATVRCRAVSLVTSPLRSSHPVTPRASRALTARFASARSPSSITLATTTPREASTPISV